MEISLKSGVIHANTGGVDFRADAKVIVFVHGAGVDQSVWVLFNRFFARNGFSTLAIDLPGHGKSTGDPLGSIEAMSQCLVDVLDSIGIAEVALVGHSMGSLVALETACRAGNRVSRLVLLGTACPMPVSDALLDAARENRHQAVDMIMLYGHAYGSLLGGNPVPGLNIVNSTMRLMERSLNGLLFTDLKACNDYGHGLAAAAQVRSPTGLILGARDRMTPPAASQALAGELDSPRVRVLPGCGHMMMSEQPEAVHAALVEALSGP